jgi:hypothetical protein
VGGGGSLNGHFKCQILRLNYAVAKRQNLMAANPKLEKLSWIAGIVGTIVALVALAVTFAPHAPSSQPQSIKQEAGDHSTQIGQISGGTVSVNNQYGDPVNHPIPNVYDLTYDQARKLLIKAGWIPALRPWQDGDSVDVQSGNGPVFWKRDYKELESCSGTGEAFCKFAFFDPRDHILTVVTAGEEWEDGSGKAKVRFAHLETPEEKADREDVEKREGAAALQAFKEAAEKDKAAATGNQ